MLSLDATAVLFTPVVLALAARLRLSPLPFAMATVWLANTVSPLLPVPDLTNSLAVGRLELPVTAYARMMLFAGAAPACLLLVRRC